MVNTVTRTGDASLNKTAMTEMARTSNKIEEANRRVMTGTKMTTFQDAAEDSARILNLEVKLSSLKDYEKGETTVLSRLHDTERIIRHLNDMTIDYRARLNRASSYGVVDTSFQSYCKNQLNEVERLLNSKDSEGRYLFGGDVTTTHPVDVSKVVAPGLGSPVSFAYYQGTSTKPVAMIGEGDIINYGATADQPGFAKLINALKIGATTAPSNDVNSDQYKKLQIDATNWIEQASNEIPDALQDVGVTMKMVEESLARKESTESFAQGLLSDLTEANYVESLFQLNKLQVLLQSSFITHQKMSENIDDLLNALRNMR